MPNPDVIDGPSGPGSSSGSSGQQTTLSSLDAPCDGNSALTASVVLKNLEEDCHTLFLRDGGTTTSVVLGFRYDNGAIRCTAPFHSSGGAPDAEATLSVDITLSVTSEDGELKETVQGTISRTAYSAVMDFEGAQPAKAIAGTLPLLPMTGYDVSVQYALKLHPGFRAGGGALIQQGTNGSVGQVRNLGTFNP